MSINSTPRPQQPLSLIENDMHQLDAVIARRLSSSVPMVGQVAQYIISSGGKRLRPAVLLLMTAALGCDDERRHSLAAIVEFIHTATLLHDDVVDESTLRRGQSTANEVFGNQASVLVGDFLYSRAFQMMVESNNMRIMHILAEATNVIAEGEVMQLMNIGDASLDETAYLEVIRSKTAKLFEASCQIAAVLAQSTSAIEQACLDYGQSLGTAFQVIDDALDYDGDTQEMGKNMGDDLREGKVTLPLIITMRTGSPAQARLVREAIENCDHGKSAEIVQLVRSNGSLQRTRQAAQEQARLAMKALQALPDNIYTQALLQLPAQLLDRRA